MMFPPWRKLSLLLFLCLSNPSAEAGYSGSLAHPLYNASMEGGGFPRGEDSALLTSPDIPQSENHQLDQIEGLLANAASAIQRQVNLWHNREKDQAMGDLELLPLVAEKRSGIFLTKKNIRPWGDVRDGDDDEDTLLDGDDDKSISGQQGGGGKRSFGTWGGKRSFGTWGGKRSFGTWGGKRSFGTWGGKRSFGTWGGKRSFGTWGGKRGFGMLGGKRNFGTWGGKRGFGVGRAKQEGSPLPEPSSNDPNGDMWGGKRDAKVPISESRGFVSWGGKRNGGTSEDTRVSLRDAEIPSLSEEYPIWVRSGKRNKGNSDDVRRLQVPEESSVESRFWGKDDRNG